MAVAYVSATTCALVTALGFKSFMATVCYIIEIYVIIESCLVHLFAISSETARSTVVKFCMPTCAVMGWVCTGPYVNRGHRWEENQHFIQVFECKQTCRKQFRTF